MTSAGYKKYGLLVMALLLFVAALGIRHFLFKPLPMEAVGKEVEENLTRELKRLDQDALSIMEGLSEDPEFEWDIKSHYLFYLFYGQDLIQWSDHSFVPSENQVREDFTLKHVKTAGGDYIAKKWKLSESKYLVGLIPLRRQYPIHNDYLMPQWNEAIFHVEGVLITDSEGKDGTSVCVYGHCLFKVQLEGTGVHIHPGWVWVSFGLYLVSLVLFLVFSYRALGRFKQKRPDEALVFITLSLLVVRILLGTFELPGNPALFDPKNFASSNLNRSLGDLLLNEACLLMVCMYLFRNYYRFRLFHFLRSPSPFRLAGRVLCVLLVFFAALYPYIVIQTISNNSAVALDVSRSIRFDGLRVAAFGAVMLAGITAFLFSHVFIRLALDQKSRRTLFAVVLLAAAVFALINEGTGQRYASTLLTGIGALAMVIGLNLLSGFRKPGYTTFIYIFVSVFFYSANGAYAIHQFSLKRKMESQFRFASHFLVDRDYFGEYLLQEAKQQIAGDAFIRSRLMSPFLGKEAVRQKIRQVFLPSYFNKYDVNILLFSSSGLPLGNDVSFSITDLLSRYDSSALKTDYTGVYYVAQSVPDFEKQYLAYIPVDKGGRVSGYIFLEFSLKKIIPENVFPELLVDNRFRNDLHEQELSYAVFTSSTLQYNSGDFNYELYFDRSWLTDPGLYSEGLSRAGFDHIAVEDQNNKVIVSSSSAPFLFSLSNFSFLLSLGLFLALAVVFVQGLANFYGKGIRLFYSARIQVYMNMAFLVPLLAVSIMAITLTGLSSERQLQSTFIQRAENLATQLNQNAEISDGQGDMGEGMESMVTRLAQMSNVEANIFSGQGVLMASSQPKIFGHGLLSVYVNPKALLRVQQGENVIILRETTGRLTYFVTYIALKSPTSGALWGILGVPFFQSDYSLEQLQIALMVNILNLFALIFLILLVLSYFVSQWLTFPLQLITRQLSKTTLSKTSQPLLWKSEDEIGLMVKEYNQMLLKLMESKADLEKNQRERAWREMAQQVAHEIKNPLTPMKLTLQQLERSVRGGDTGPEKVRKAIDSLMDQVNTLNDIASSFSTFARMPEPIVQEIEVVALVRRVVSLHSQADDLVVRTQENEVIVMGDESVLGRAFSNLILNAYQAARPGVKLTLEIDITIDAQYCLLRFRDNGKGIEEGMKERVFMPYFTTKKSGSGLGLSISKQGIDQIGGKIWFESVENVGTVFYVQLKRVHDSTQL